MHRDLGVLPFISSRLVRVRLRESLRLPLCHSVSVSVLPAHVSTPGFDPEEQSSVTHTLDFRLMTYDFSLSIANSSGKTNSC